MAVEDLQRAADVFRPIHDVTDGVDGFVSLEVSPTLAYDTDATVREAKALHARADRAQPVHQDPGHPAGPARDRGVHRRRRARQRDLAVLGRRSTWRQPTPTSRASSVASPQGLNPAVASVASVFMSRWDAAVADRVDRAI